MGHVRVVLRTVLSFHKKKENSAIAESDQSNSSVAIEFSEGKRFAVFPTGWQDSHACTKRRLRLIFRSAYTGLHSEKADKCRYIGTRQGPVADWD
jgi:hypothetical protein